MTDFNPKEAIQTLNQNAQDIESLGEEIHQTRLQLTRAHGILIDAEVAARKKMFTEGIKASFARDFIKMEIAKEEKDYEILKDILRDLEHRLHIIEEVNNTKKLSYRIANNINF